ncbi:hypothetical protein ACFOY2_06200 [Nonomuraea purpurea]|uniref:Uncharacterized protein n=1 Tax=Nonomuraea purpurea TaxID=1849276 RepID=A0ABV8G2J8_9ACTN
MTAVIVSLVAVVLLVLVVVALGMRSMNRRESSLPPERLKEMAEKEEKTQTRSTDQFAAHEPRMNNFSPDFSPIGEAKPKPVRTGQRGRRGVDEWGNPSSDDDDEEFWANLRSDAEEGGFGAGGTVAARKGASRPVERERPAAERPAERPSERPSERRGERPAERPSERRGERRAKPKPAAASADPNATTVQAPLPQRQVPAQAANLADLVEPAKRAAAPQSEMADQRTMTFAAPTGDVMSILGAGAQPAPAPRPDPVPSSNGSASPFAASGNGPASSFQSSTGTGTHATGTGGFPAANSSGSFPAASPVSSGSFPAAPAPIHGAPTSDPFPAYGGTGDPLETTWTNPPAAAAASPAWPTPPDILDDAPAASYGSGTSWPAFDQPAANPSYPASYEVRSGWAVADDTDPLTGPSPATGTPTVPGRAVSSSSYDDVLSASAPPPQTPFAYETGDITTVAGWPEPPSGGGVAGNWPGHGENPQGTGGGRRRRAPEQQDYPHDYYR